MFPWPQRALRKPTMTRRWPFHANVLQNCCIFICQELSQIRLPMTCPAPVQPEHAEEITCTSRSREGEARRAHSQARKPGRQALGGERTCPPCARCQVTRSQERPPTVRMQTLDFLPAVEHLLIDPQFPSNPGLSNATPIAHRRGFPGHPRP